ncbi:hypothetical protein [Streptomyces sp. NPDC004267]|uniref:hypothetical protein n=1 Tax=Streptomyces sp. NPDC004267 TaxID=3364694 RepID=UPI0036A0F0F3
MTNEERSLTAAVRGLARGCALGELVDLWQPVTWLALDERIRSGTDHGIERPDPRRPAAPPGLPDGPAPAEAELVLALCDADGHLREAALAHAARLPAVLPLVAVRTTDWVPAVRARAWEVLSAALPAADERTLAATVPVILRLRDRKRGGMAAGMLQELLRAAPPASLTALLRNPDRRTRRIALGLAVERGLLSPAELAHLAAHDEDVAVRSRAADAALAAGVPDETLPLLLGARSGAVRSAGVTALRGAGRAAEAEPYLFDRSGLVRACARWVLRQDGRDPLPLYRAACADPATVPDRAPLGLAECGDRKTDAAVLWELTGHDRAAVRACAVMGLRVLEVADIARLLPLLDDPAPGVVREAARALLPWADRLPEAELLRRAGADRPAHVRKRVRRLLDALGSTAYEETARQLVEDAEPVPGPVPVPRARVRRWFRWNRPLRPGR